MRLRDLITGILPQTKAERLADWELRKGQERAKERLRQASLDAAFDQECAKVSFPLAAHIINGVPVFVHPWLAPRNVPKRVYKKRQWMTPAHHRRVQKKWIKRYGTECRDEIIRTAEGIFMSAQNYKRICEGLK